MKETINCILLVVLLIGLISWYVSSRGDYNVHRRKQHAYANIVFDKHSRPTGILVHNLDDVDVAELGRNWNFSNNTRRERLGNGVWLYHFQDEADYDELRETESNLNAFLEQVINTAKDRS